MRKAAASAAYGPRQGRAELHPRGLYHFHILNPDGYDDGEEEHKVGPARIFPDK